MESIRNSSFVVDRELAQECFQGSQENCFGDRPHGKAIGDSHRAQQVIGVELGADQLSCDHLVALEMLQETANDGGFARADLARDDDEALALVESVLQIGIRALVSTASKEESRIRVELEGFAGQAVEGLVHAVRSVKLMRQADEHCCFGITGPEGWVLP